MIEKFSPELLLSIAGFAISVGGFVQIFFLEGAGKKKIISLATALALLCVLFGAAVFDFYQFLPIGWYAFYRKEVMPADR